MDKEKKKNIDKLFVVATFDKKESEKLAVEPYSYWRSVYKAFKKKPSAIFAVSLLVLMIVFTVFVPIFSPYDIKSVYLDSRLQEPSLQHLFGTNAEGRDMFTLIWVGARTSMVIALIVTLINTFLGVIIGGLWGYFKKLDIIMLEVYNFIINIPALLQYMILLYVLGSLGSPPEFNLVIAMTITGWSGLARMIRNQILVFNNREYNIASRALGSSAGRIIVNNLLPYILSVIITTVSLSISGVIRTEVSLAYFGLGLPVDSISLGRILRESYNSWLATPYILIYPAIVVGMITIVFYLIGLALSDALDPRTHR